jgi:hypothetical protein
LFLIYNVLKIADSPQQVAKQHATTLKSKAYLVGKLAIVVWGED